MIRHAGYLLLFAVVVALLAPAASPIQLSHVTSDSMEPTIGTGDGYVLVPAGDVIPGEIVTFYSEEREGYVTHRVAGTTTGGFITKGDANPSTDQEAGSPPVPREAITGQVLTTFGQPVLIPQLGTAVGLIRANWSVLFGLIAAGLLFNTLRSGSTGRQTAERSVLRSRQVVITTLVIGLLASTLLVSMGAIHSEFTYPVTETGDGTARQLAVGEATTVEMQASMSTTPLTATFVETDGMNLLNISRDAAGGETNATAGGQNPESGFLGGLRSYVVATTGLTINAEIPGQAEPGSHTVALSVHPYPKTLPRDTLALLHGIHPMVATLGSVLVPFSLAYIGYWLVVDPSTPLRASRRRWLQRMGDR
ncbi:MAG: signal peptidase I, archaeal type [Halonotius sp. J07HN6]|nr:MAG: signal peptidase I, archaeal type [Halonotius sp. J07HN6]